MLIKRKWGCCFITRAGEICLALSLSPGHLLALPHSILTVSGQVPQLRLSRGSGPLRGWSGLPLPQENPHRSAVLANVVGNSAGGGGRR